MDLTLTAISRWHSCANATSLTRSLLIASQLPREADPPSTLACCGGVPKTSQCGPNTLTASVESAGLPCSTKSSVTIPDAPVVRQILWLQSTSRRSLTTMLMFGSKMDTISSVAGTNSPLRTRRLVEHGTHLLRRRDMAVLNWAGTRGDCWAAFSRIGVLLLSGGATFPQKQLLRPDYFHCQTRSFRRLLCHVCPFFRRELAD